MFTRVRRLGCTLAVRRRGIGNLAGASGVVRLLPIPPNLAAQSAKTLADGRPSHNPAVAGSHPIPSTGFDGFEILEPSGYTKGRCLRVSAFSRSIAKSGNDFE